jgi:hypothetical protein
MGTGLCELYFNTNYLNTESSSLHDSEHSLLLRGSESQFERTDERDEKTLSDDSISHDESIIDICEYISDDVETEDNLY